MGFLLLATTNTKVVSIFTCIAGVGRKKPVKAAAAAVNGGQTWNWLRAFEEGFMVSTVVASISPNGDRFAGN